MASDGQRRDDLDERFSAYVDALMDERERAAFDRELAEDPELAAELERFEQTLEVLRRMPVAKAPDDFLRGVQNRIRRRTRGRWYGIQAGRLRFPFEAAFNILLIGILFSIYLSAKPAVEHPVPVAPTVDRSTAVRDLLAPLGAVTVAADAAVAGAVTAALTLEAAKLPALRALVAGQPELALVGEPTEAPDGRLSATLRWTPAAERGPPR